MTICSGCVMTLTFVTYSSSCVPVRWFTTSASVKRLVQLGEGKLF